MNDLVTLTNCCNIQTPLGPLVRNSPRSKILDYKLHAMFSCRYKLPIVFIVMNNNGIGFGTDAESFYAMCDNSDPAMT